MSLGFGVLLLCCLAIANGQIIGKADEVKAKEAPVVAGSIDCVDKDEHCESWFTFCRTNDWVAKTCVRTCTNCDGHAPSTTTEVPTTAPHRACRDSNETCKNWVQAKPSLCSSNDFIFRSCKESCGACGEVPKQYNLKNLPIDLDPIGFLVGKWRSEFGGKAFFPTIPNSTFGEQIDFQITEPPQFGARFLNYTSFAWGVNNKEALHSEYGFIMVRNKTNEIALTTVMDNGFTTVEEGRIEGKQIKLKLQYIGRISFVRDLAVHDIQRTWKLLDDDTLEGSLAMETATNGLQEHTKIVYKKIFP